MRLSSSRGRVLDLSFWHAFLALCTEELELTGRDASIAADDLNTILLMAWSNV